MSQAASSGTHADQKTGDPVTSPEQGQSFHASDLVKVYQPIVSQLKSVEELLRSEIRSDMPWVDRLLEHNWIEGGKRIRPVFLLLSGAACGEICQQHLQLATAVEMIHAATLVHDDVLDKAQTRRHLPTVNAKWGDRVSVLLGDYLFTHAFYVASSAMNPTAVKILAQSSNRVCEGEIQQNAWQGEFEITEQDYMAMISHKTAELCGCSCRLGALLSGADDATISSFGVYGQNLGVAFQIIDDVLDLVGQPNKVGKTLGTDLINQKPTLPIIHALKNASPTERSQLLSLLQSDNTSVADVLPLLNQTGSIDHARSVAQDHASSASRFASELPPSEYSESLQALAEFVLKRTH